MSIAFFGVMVGLVSAFPALFMPGISSLETVLIYLCVSITTVFMQAAMLAWPSKKLTAQDG